MSYECYAPSKDAICSWNRCFNYIYTIIEEPLRSSIIDGLTNKWDLLHQEVPMLYAGLTSFFFEKTLWLYWYFNEFIYWWFFKIKNFIYHEVLCQLFKVYFIKVIVRANSTHWSQKLDIWSQFKYKFAVWKIDIEILIYTCTTEPALCLWICSCQSAEGWIKCIVIIITACTNPSCS